MQINGAPALSAIGNAAQSQSALASDFDSFLTLLTTQLQNQNPLEPLDTNEFTAQLVQFTNVEQAIQANKNLEQLVALSLTTAFNNTVGYIGKTVVASGNVTQLENGQATWTYSLSGDATEANVTIRDSSGAAVFAQTRPLVGGTHTYTWDGRLEDGTAAPEGAYSIEIEAKDADGNALEVATEIVGVVEEVDLTGIEPLLRVNGSQISLSAVSAIRQD